MSIFTDVLRLLDGEANAFAFLPAVNQGYIYWKATNPSLAHTAISLSYLLISVALFNILTHGEFHRYGPNKERMETKYAISLLVIMGIWVGALALSVIKLYDHFSSGELWPVLLSAISLLFVCLLITHVVLNQALPMYDPD
jgi:hypothetical protein